MALEYTLYVSDPLTSEELLSLVEQELGLPHDRELAELLLSRIVKSPPMRKEDMHTLGR